MLFYSHISGGQYFIGDYEIDREKFIVTDHGKFNFGASGPAGVHAPSAAPDGKGGVICIFNMNPGFPNTGWNQIMTLPREFTLKDKILHQEPAGNIESLRYGKQSVGSTVIPSNKEIVLENIKGNAMEIIAEIDPMGSPMVEINVLRSPNKEEFTRIAFFKNRGMYQGRNYKQPPPENWKMQQNSILSIESSYSSILPNARSRPPESAPILLEKNENLKLRIFIDKSVVEVFANGKQCIAMRVYPGLEESVGVSLYSQGQEAELISLEAYQMKGIY